MNLVLQFRRLTKGQLQRALGRHGGAPSASGAAGGWFLSCECANTNGGRAGTQPSGQALRIRTYRWLVMHVAGKLQCVLVRRRRPRGGARDLRRGRRSGHLPAQRSRKRSARDRAGGSSVTDKLNVLRRVPTVRRLRGPTSEVLCRVTTGQCCAFLSASGTHYPPFSSSRY